MRAWTSASASSLNEIRLKSETEFLIQAADPEGRQWYNNV